MSMGRADPGELAACSITGLSSQVAPDGAERPLAALQLLANGRVQTATGDTGTALVFNDVSWWLSTQAAPIADTDWECQLEETASGGSDTGSWTGSGLGSGESGWKDLTGTVVWTLGKDDNSIGDVDKTVTIRVRQKSDNDNISTDASNLFTVFITA